MSSPVTARRLLLAGVASMAFGLATPSAAAPAPRALAPRALAPRALAPRALVPRDVDEACATSRPSAFVDRPEGAVGAAVDCVASYGVTAGTTATTYEPGRPVTRGQMASFLARVLVVAGRERPEVAEDHFTDDETSVHEADIDLIYEAGLTSGFGGAGFGPGVGVSRNQLASFLARQIEYSSGVPLPDPEVDYFGDDQGDVHEARVNQLAGLGVVAGVDEGRYDPSSVVTRGQAALFFSRTLDHLSEDADVPLRSVAAGIDLAGPELVAAALGTATGPTTSVDLLFDEPVTELAAPGAFRVTAYDGVPTPADGLALVPANPRVVRAIFPRRAANTATVVGVVRQAVAGVRGSSPEGSAALRNLDIQAGFTSAPDLIGTSRLGPLTVDFNFDEIAYVGNGSGYRLVLADGSVERSTSARGDGTTAHVVEFPGLTAGDAASVVRAHVIGGTVGDAPAGAGTRNVNPQQAVDVSGRGDLARRPDLVELIVDEPSSSVRYLFDEEVRLADLTATIARFRTYDLRGRQFSSSTATLDGPGTSVTVRYDEGAFGAGVAGGSVDAGLVLGADGSNEVDELGIPTRFAAGETAAPDLVLAGRTQSPESDGSVRSMVFLFDDDIELWDDTAFSVYDVGGARTVLSSCAVDADPRAVRCRASSISMPIGHAAIGAAVRVGVAEGAVAGAASAFPNPLGAARL